MDDAVESTLWHQLGATPMRDLVRGRLTGRLDWRKRVRNAALPMKALTLVEQVVEHTRLWRLEQAAVADELLAHFLDGVSDGASAEELVGRFGEPRVAARLIRRAKLRNRPVLWHLWRWGLRGGVGAALFYGCLTLYFLAGRPTVKVNYLAVLNRSVLQTPAAERAWPAYREALLSLHQSHAVPYGWDRDEARSWAQAAALLPRYRMQLEQLRRAAALPNLGFVFGREGSAADAELFPKLPDRPQADEPALVLGILLPYLQEFRYAAELLTDDAHAADEQDDAGRFVADWRALHGMADQLNAADGSILCGLISLGTRNLAEDRLARFIAERPGALDDATLVGIAHQLAGPRVAADVVDLAGQRVFIDDAVQRMYTDDGRGDGRMTRSGLHLLWDINHAQFPTNLRDPWNESWQNAAAAALSPTSVGVMASRRELTDRLDRIFDAVRRDAEQPMRSADWDAVDAELVRLRGSRVDWVRYAPLVSLLPTFHPNAAMAERYLGFRDGLVVAIALELYHRQHDRYPDSLGELTPRLLPNTPADRITGEPVKYRLVEGKPVVYSVGVDRVDDGGRYPTSSRGIPWPNAFAAEWGSAVRPELKGDWVLFPPEPVDRFPSR